MGTDTAPSPTVLKAIRTLKGEGLVEGVHSLGVSVTSKN
jgi:hypothetical protein